MRYLTALGFAKELGVRHYTSTPKTGFFVTGSPLRDPIIHMYVTCFVPSLLRRINLGRTLTFHQRRPFPGPGPAPRVLPEAWLQEPDRYRGRALPVCDGLSRDVL